MNEAEKFLNKNIRTISIDGVSFKFRRMNPKEIYMMNRNLNEIRKKQQEDKKEGDSEDSEERTEGLRLTVVEMQQLADADTRVALTRCVLDPKIVLKSYGEQDDNEIPFDFVDNQTATALFDAIQKFSMEVFDGVSLSSFPDEQSGVSVDGDEFILKHPSESVGGQLRSEDEQILEDEIGRILREGEEVGDGSEKQDSGRAKRKTRRKKEAEEKRQKKSVRRDS